MSWVTCLFRTHWHHGSTNVAQSIIKQTIAWHRFCLVYIDIHICRFNYLCRPHEAAKSLRLFSSRRFLWSGFLLFIRNYQVAQNQVFEIPGLGRFKNPLYHKHSTPSIPLIRGRKDVDQGEEIEFLFWVELVSTIEMVERYQLKFRNDIAIPLYGGTHIKESQTLPLPA